MSFLKIAGIAAAFISVQLFAAAADNVPAFKINDKVTTIGELKKADQAAFYEFEKKIFDHVDGRAREAYLDSIGKPKQKRKTRRQTRQKPTI